MTDLNGTRVVITGAASGLGKRLVMEFARRRASISAWDINAQQLEVLRAEVERTEAAAFHTAVVDVGDRDTVQRAAEEVREAFGTPDILFNNAGIVNGKTLLESSDEAIERTFRVNTLGLFWTTRAFLPDMMRRNSGHIVNVASAAGTMGVSGLADYCASKFAAVGFDESLRMELRKQGSRVRTTVICPYYINTGMFDGVRTKYPWLMPILEEEYAVRRILRAVERNDNRLLMPALVYVVPLMRLLPVPAFDAIATFLGINESMDHFVGRAEDATRAAAQRSDEVRQDAMARGA
ncbi:MAG: SDR family NAD(P)-dependent oxidoreductase [Deltaproteobacteria bacterium]|nr:MAG: SDR family NAD(P)-dependent oxidoreductase [Deltaproteobacteria bacterium]